MFKNKIWNSGVSESLNTGSSKYISDFEVIKIIKPSVQVFICISSDTEIFKYRIIKKYPLFWGYQNN